jgi:glycine betaine/proline transport system substrate-binding protein
MQTTAAWVRVTALIGVAAVALAGCAADIQPRVPAPGVPAGAACGTVTLAVNPWAGYEANLAVLSYLAKQRLHCTVVEKNISEDDAWKELATGDVDAIVENWGHDALKKKYIDQDKLLVEQGVTGNRGVIGWYVPPWLAKKYPDITDWRQLNKYAHLFQTDKSGGKGQFLDGDPHYVTNDEALVRNLKLDYKVIFTGSEDALITAYRKAEEQHKPVIGYFYAPQWFLTEVDMVHIELPTYTPGCDANPSTVACDYQPFDLDKIVSKKFAESGSPAAALLRNFQWTNADQNTVARYITGDKMSRDDAAKKWLDANPKAWQDWLPAS